MNKEIIERLGNSLKNVSEDLTVVINSLSNEISKTDNPEHKQQKADLLQAVQSIKSGDLESVVEIHKKYADKIN